MPFDGEVVGEHPESCHALRDRKLLLEFTNVDAKLHDVIIVGGGVSGLAAAWKLFRSGVRNLLVVERGDRIGGTSVAGHAGGIDFAWGAHYVESPGPGRGLLHELYEDLGVIVDYDGEWPVPNRAYVVPEPEVGLLAGNRWHPGRFPYQIATSQDVVEYEAFRQDMYRWMLWQDAEGRPAFARSIERTSASETVRRLDRITMREYLDTIGIRSEVVAWYVDNRCVDEYGLRVDDVSAWAGIQFWAQSNSSFSDFDPPGTPSPKLLSWPEGNAFLVNGLARGLSPDQVTVGTMVANVTNRPDRVLVTCVRPDGSTVTLQARAVIFAAPKHLVAHVIPAMKASGRDEFDRCRYVPWLTAAVHVEERPRRSGYRPAWELLAHDAWGLGYIDNRHMTPETAGYHDEGTVWTFYAALCDDLPAQRQELLSEGWDYWAGVVLGSLERMHPGIERSITRLDVHKWGHAMAAMTPGYLWGPERQAMRQPFGRVHFAGADVGGTPVFEQAVNRGVETAEAVMDGFGVSYSSSL